MKRGHIKEGHDLETQKLSKDLAASIERTSTIISGGRLVPSTLCFFFVGG